MSDAANVNPSNYTEFRAKAIENCEKVIKGKSDVIEKVLVCFLCSGHVLLEDVPGTGKTMLLRAFAKTMGGSMKRIQFTPDLLPSDLTGINFFNRKTDEFQFRAGPLFANMILADEINRATPRTQSALLEAMAEGQVTVDGDTHPMADPFMIMATQNPIESYGTFPLPEAQTDRFFMRLSMGYMEREQEIAVMQGEDTGTIVNRLEPVVSFEEISHLKAGVRNIEVSDDVSGYLMSLIEKTRTDPRIRVGVSTRGTIALFNASKALAALRGRSYVIPEDIKELAPVVLAHRISAAGALNRLGAEDLIAELAETVPVPLEDIR